MATILAGAGRMLIDLEAGLSIKARYPPIA
jgi:hypothetical protein